MNPQDLDAGGYQDPNAAPGWGQPPQQPQWQWQPPQQPQWPQPQWPQPPAQQPAAQPWQPQPAQPWDPQWQQPDPAAGAPGGGQWGPPPYGAPGIGWPAAEPPKKSRRGRLVAALAAVVVVAGGAATFVAVSDKSSAGAATPQGAVTSLLKDLDNADLLGLLDHLPPAERSSILDPVQDQISQLKRLQVLTPAADAHNVSGLKVTATGLKFSGRTEAINARVSVVELTAGKITVNVDLDKIPYTDAFLKVVFKGRSQPSGSRSRTIDVQQLVQMTGKPIRIATQKAGGKWYPSIFYTVADNAVHSDGGANPAQADYIGAAGASSATGAVTQLVKAIGDQDAAGLIKLMPPDEMAVMHDYGALLTKSMGEDDPSEKFTVDDLQLTTAKVTHGVLVSLRSLSVTTPDGKATFSVDNDCVHFSADGDSGSFCSEDLIGQVTKLTSLTADEKSALQRLFQALPSVGVVATEVSGKWYVSPVRTYGEQLVAVLGKLQSGDLLTLLGMLDRLDR